MNTEKEQQEVKSIMLDVTKDTDEMCEDIVDRYREKQKKFVSVFFLLYGILLLIAIAFIWMR